MIAHAFLTVCFLLSFQVVSFLLNAPLLAYNVNKVVNRNHMFDATEIFRTLGQHKKGASPLARSSLERSRSLSAPE